MGLISSVFALGRSQFKKRHHWRSKDLPIGAARKYVIADADPDLREVSHFDGVTSHIFFEALLELLCMEESPESDSRKISKGGCLSL